VLRIKFCGGRQFSVPKPPLLLAANRYHTFEKKIRRSDNHFTKEREQTKFKENDHI